MLRYIRNINNLKAIEIRRFCTSDMPDDSGEDKRTKAIRNSQVHDENGKLIPLNKDILKYKLRFENKIGELAAPDYYVNDYAKNKSELTKNIESFENQKQKGILSYIFGDQNSQKIEKENMKKNKLMFNKIQNEQHNNKNEANNVRETNKLLNNMSNLFFNNNNKDNNIIDYKLNLLNNASSDGDIIDLYDYININFMENNFNIINSHSFINILHKTNNKKILKLLLNYSFLNNLKIDTNAIFKILDLYKKSDNTIYLEYLKASYNNSNINKDMLKNIVNYYFDTDFNIDKCNYLIIFHSLFKLDKELSINYINQFMSIILNLKLFTNENSYEFNLSNILLTKIKIQNYDLFKVYLLENFLSEKNYITALERLVNDINLLYNLVKNNTYNQAMINNYQNKFKVDLVNEVNNNIKKIFEYYELPFNLESPKSNNDSNKFYETKFNNIIQKGSYSIIYKKSYINNYEVLKIDNNMNFNLGYDDLVNYNKLNSKEKFNYYYNYINDNKNYINDVNTILEKNNISDSIIKNNIEGANLLFNYVSDKENINNYNYNKNNKIKNVYYKNRINRYYSTKTHKFIFKNVNINNNIEDYNKFDICFFERILLNCNDYKDCINVIEDYIKEHNNSEFVIKGIMYKLLTINKLLNDKADSYQLFKYLYFQKCTDKEKYDNSLKIRYKHKDIDNYQMDFNKYRIKYNICYDNYFYKELFIKLKDNFNLSLFFKAITNYNKLTFLDDINNMLILNTCSKNIINDAFVDFFYLILSSEKKINSQFLIDSINYLSKFKNNNIYIIHLLTHFYNKYNYEPIYNDFTNYIDTLITRKEYNEFNNFYNFYKNNICKYYNISLNDVNKNSENTNINILKDFILDCFTIAYKHDYKDGLELLYKDLLSLNIFYSIKDILTLVKYQEVGNDNKIIINNIEKLTNLTHQDFYNLLNTILEYNSKNYSADLHTIYFVFIVKNRLNFDDNIYRLMLQIIYKSNNVSSFFKLLPIIYKNRDYKMPNSLKNLTLGIIKNSKEKDLKIKLLNLILSHEEGFLNKIEKNKSVYDEYNDSLRNQNELEYVHYRDLKLKTDYFKVDNPAENALRTKKHHGSNYAKRNKIKTKLDFFNNMMEEDGIHLFYDDKTALELYKKYLETGVLPEE